MPACASWGRAAATQCSPAHSRWVVWLVMVLVVGLAGLPWLG